MNEEAIKLLENTKILALVFETYQERTPKAVTRAIFETFTNINQALALLREEPCKTCGGSGQVGDEIVVHGRSMGWKSCPACQQKESKP